MEWMNENILNFGMSQVLESLHFAVIFFLFAFNNYAITIDHMFMFSIYGFLISLFLTPFLTSLFLACRLPSITYIFLLVMCSSSSVFIAIGWLTLSKAYLRLFFFILLFAFIASLHNNNSPFIPQTSYIRDRRIPNQFRWLRFARAHKLFIFIRCSCMISSV